ncbi:MAG: hypothetical protein IOC86_09715 [Aestuariivirga sp.]|nr:hypothetical protein [Aestuariivirga sp.]
MKSIKMALLGGAALAVTAAGAQADDLDALKAQIEELNARVAAMETAPAVPAGYQLIAISEGELQQTPGLQMSAREKFSYGNRSTIISVLPTADAPAGTTISWSGYVYAGIRYKDSESNTTIRAYAPNGSEWNGSAPFFFVANEPDFVAGTIFVPSNVSGTTVGYNTVVQDGGTTLGQGFINLPIEVDVDPDGDWDIPARGQLRVNATTDTAVGEVGVDIRLRGNFNGNGNADVYMDVAWGYWAMTPELTFGGGYAESLGKINYGYAQGCTCYLTANAGLLGLDPGDVSQLRMSYGSGPFTMAIAVEDAGIRAPGQSGTDGINAGELGAAGSIGYSGDLFSGEIAGVWRSINDEDYDDSLGNAPEDLWQVGAGVKFGFTEMFNLQLAGAIGSGPTTVVDQGQIVDGTPYSSDWWTVSALAQANLSDEFSAEIGVAYTDREGEGFDAIALNNLWESDGVELTQWGILGGIYYTPVDQLTIGVEGEWWTTDSEFSTEYVAGLNPQIDKVKWETETDNWSVDLIAVWRF